MLVMQLTDVDHNSASNNHHESLGNSQLANRVARLAFDLPRVRTGAF